MSSDSYSSYTSEADDVRTWRDPPLLDLSIMIVSYNVVGLLRSCLKSVFQSLGKFNTEVWVVDNASEDSSASMVALEFPDVHLICNELNQGFAYANNQVLRRAKGRFLMLLNPDTLIIDDALEQLLYFLDCNPHAAVVGPQLIQPDGKLQTSFRAYPSLGSILHSLVGHLWPAAPVRLSGEQAVSYQTTAGERQVNYILGACLMARREAVQKVGLLDEQFYMYGEDADWCLRFWKAKWQVWFCPQARVVHYAGQSAVTHGPMESPDGSWARELLRSEALFLRKHRGLLIAWCAGVVRKVFALLALTKWYLVMILGGGEHAQHRVGMILKYLARLREAYQ